MAYRTAVAFFICVLTCSCSLLWASDQPTPGSSDPQNLKDVRNAHLDAKTDADVAEFVKAHAGEKINTLGLSIGACTATGLSYLRQLNGLDTLSISVMSDPDKHPAEGGTSLLFKPILRDDWVEEIAQIQSLKAIQIWYGCLSGKQRVLLKRKLPNCEVGENLNKF